MFTLPGVDLHNASTILTKGYVSALDSFCILVFTPIPENVVMCSIDTSKTYLKDV